MLDIAIILIAPVVLDEVPFEVKVSVPARNAFQINTCLFTSISNTIAWIPFCLWGSFALTKSSSIGKKRKKLTYLPCLQAWQKAHGVEVAKADEV